MHLTFENPSLIVLAGPTGIGKSSWAKRVLPESYIVSSDEARRMITDDANDQSSSADAFQLVGQLARLRFQHGRSVVIDSTALRAKDRKTLLAIAREADVPAYLVVFDGDKYLCQRGQKSRKRRVPDTIIDRHLSRLEMMRVAQGRGELEAEGFRRVDWLTRPSAEAIDGIDWVTSTASAVDVIGDVHGCASELLALLVELGYESDGQQWFHSDGRIAAFVGDLTDRGPASLATLRIVDQLVASEVGVMAAIGNHDWKLYRGLVLGRDVTQTNGLQGTLDEIEAEKAEREIIAILHRLFDSAPAHSVFDNGQLVVTHGAVYQRAKGQPGARNRRDAVSSLGLFGETTGETLASGHPERIYNWVDSWTGDETVVFGHDVVGLYPKIFGPHDNVIGLDTGCAFGGRLTALRWPEREFVSIGAIRHYSTEHDETFGDEVVESLSIARTPLG